MKKFSNNRKNNHNMGSIHNLIPLEENKGELLRGLGAW